MKKIKNLTCSKCGRVYGEDIMYTCPSCGASGTLYVNMDLPYIKDHVNRDYFKENRDYSIWRYLPLLPVEDRDESLCLNFTPLYDMKNLAGSLSLSKLYLKDEGRNPTASFKDRATCVFIKKAEELKYKTLCAASTGNAASSLSGFAASKGLKNYIFVPRKIPEPKLTQLLIYGSHVILVDGDYDTAFNLCLEASLKYGWYNRSCAINPYLCEGKKTAAFEICEQLNFEALDYVVMAVGDGCSISSVYKGFKEFYDLGLINKIPKFLSVQAEGANPVNRAIRSHERKFTYEVPNTIADSISVGIPRNGYKAYDAILNSGGSCVDVSDDEILEAVKLLPKNTGVFAEPAGAASFAGVLKLNKAGFFSKDSKVLFMISGNGLKDIKAATSVIKKPSVIKPDLNEIEKYIMEEDYYAKNTNGSYI